ncbi:preprotein translocase subunit SecG [Flavobacterium akiainvivens]|uniref:Protein-export membrane protein SecG n=1 Tax=Flavobacterium akiainvivens TaxID=1202724 RepID=A0A0M8MFF2_9FLAO|nr:preprotein translocase subunit SecG [Flavobacterium akiainvivens]KOS07784.1 preprotein translocase subunit SecG [Flavobacterium akiainvivens]SFQ26258.1 preprotein translocase subunit SecG [Flavobacterium akiainvivens]
MGFTIFLVLITIVSFLLVVVIMVQNPKGGGLSSSIGGPQIMGGVQKTTDFLDKSTWTLGTILVILILLSSLSFGTFASNDGIIDEGAVAPKTEAPAKTGVPAQPGAAQPAAPAQPAN